jgi:hypothetical protein
VASRDGYLPGGDAALLHCDHAVSRAVFRPGFSPDIVGVFPASSLYRDEFSPRFLCPLDSSFGRANPTQGVHMACGGDLRHVAGPAVRRQADQAENAAAVVPQGAGDMRDRAAAEFQRAASREPAHTRLALAIRASSRRRTPRVVPLLRSYQMCWFTIVNSCKVVVAPATGSPKLIVL